ncbi:unnamed protein product [Zymoseptoria tritici ST99CH_1A5]|uniref:Uncharacterized protein n=2 Tax=Zymoseptoria tritici TaxID=1047171 RepID=A0A1X7S874_ZYMT9|nr:unnamed protein product [Zymoseptoria tritici ST99CH_3D7]SMY29565.1 unnamed protein product [Zymoseptoria tritici ST99CH_1A5]
MFFVLMAIGAPLIQTLLDHAPSTSPLFLLLALLDLLATVAIVFYHVQKSPEITAFGILWTESVRLYEVLLCLLACYAESNLFLAEEGAPDIFALLTLINVILFIVFFGVCCELRRVLGYDFAHVKPESGSGLGQSRVPTSRMATDPPTGINDAIAEKDAEIVRLKKDHRAAMTQAGIAHANSITILEQQIENQNTELRTLEEKARTTMESERPSATDLLENAFKMKNGEIAQLKRDHQAALAQARVDGDKKVCRHPLFKEAMATLKAGSEARTEASNLLAISSDTIKKLLAERAALLKSSVTSRQKDKENVDSSYNAGGDLATLRPEAASTTDDTAGLEFKGKVTAIMESGCSVPEHRHLAPDLGTETPTGEDINSNKELCGVSEHKRLCRDPGHNQMKADLIEAAGFIDYVAHALESNDVEKMATLKSSVASRQRNKENVDNGHNAGSGPATLRTGASSTIDDTAGLEFKDLAKLQVNHSLQIIDGSVTIEENQLNDEGDGGELRLSFVSGGAQRSKSG